MSDTNLEILITAVDNASATIQGVANSLQGISSEAQKTATQVSQSFTQQLESVRSSFLQIGAVAGGAFYTIESEISAASSANEKWNLSLVDIQNTLKNTGSSIPMSQITAFSEALANTTLFSQQQVLSAEQLVVGNKDLQSSFEDIVGVASDLAAHIGTDL